MEQTNENSLRIVWFNIDLWWRVKFQSTRIIVWQNIAFCGFRNPKIHQCHRSLWTLKDRWLKIQKAVKNDKKLPESTHESNVKSSNSKQKYCFKCRSSTHLYKDFPKKRSSDKYSLSKYIKGAFAASANST